MIKDVVETLKTARVGQRKSLKKLGTIKINAVEATPVIWKDKLLRFEWIRSEEYGSAGGITRKDGYYAFIDMETEEIVSSFALCHSFGCCYEENGKMYAFGPQGNGGGRVVDSFVSSDLKNWEQREILTFPEDIKVYNNSVCKGDGRYIMSIEIGGKNQAVGNPFTCVFAESKDLINWTMLDMMEYSYSRHTYTACPVIRYVDGYYYMICLMCAPYNRYVPYIVRSRDLKEFEVGIRNPIMWPDDSDKQVIHPERFSAEELDYLEHAVDCNNSDIDLCEIDGKTLIIYSWGNQLGKEFLALAEYDGSMAEFLKSFFL
ncbi:MAG: hypothetical protein E7565_08330 [Ruminococcaceae bacterium]|nr:hypothetical protein [Oscillospiraceae bacterium]